MPKTSAIERNKKRVRLVDQHKAKRAELKAILANAGTSDEDFFAAQKKLAKLPKEEDAKTPNQKTSVAVDDKTEVAASPNPASQPDKKV